ncbi:NRDE family protein [Nocardia sp. NBC_01503]|uniref:NRDE family protein n=1 Tax=Nocardia sp. NBC_01503 TaxID=2975997 RepID=UPI002E7ABBF0|nr:NRDE family protein [Nocardia sp. NBC_01503]WTL34982.1 NRDE family protein [Nocardia sp. NBC_01503]
MCLVLLGWRAHPEYRLIVAANRDEFFTRPTESLRWWEEMPGLLAGRDMGAAGPVPGTWLGLDRDAHRFAAVTNVRGPNEKRADARSRGALLLDFLRGEQDSEKFVRSVAAAADDYNGFNLAVSDLESLWWHGNRGEQGPRELSAGFHGLSNGALATSLWPDGELYTGTDTPVWPKVREGLLGLHRAVQSNPADVSGYLAVLADRQRAADAELPDTGVGRFHERTASSRFVNHPLHGTRCSTVLLVREDGRFEMTERTFGRFARRKGTVSFHGRLDLPA